MHIFIISVSLALSLSPLPPHSQDGSPSQLPGGYEPERLAKYGTLDVAFEYDSGKQHLAVTVTAATDIPVLKQTGNIAWQVKKTLLLYLSYLLSHVNIFSY